MPDESTPPKPKDATEPSTEEQESVQEGVVDISALPVGQILPIFLGVLDRVAWQRIGLVVNPQTQKIEKDLEQARVAIDCYEAILKNLGTQVSPEIKRHLEARLTDLKLNFGTHS